MIHLQPRFVNEDEPRFSVRPITWIPFGSDEQLYSHTDWDKAQQGHIWRRGWARAIGRGADSDSRSHLGAPPRAIRCTILYRDMFPAPRIFMLRGFIKRHHQQQRAFRPDFHDGARTCSG